MKKILAFALALAMILTCSLALADRLDDIKAAGKLTVATSPDWPPYEYIDDDGNIVGTDILMCQWMAEQLGVELEVQPMAFDACLAAVGGNGGHGGARAAREQCAARGGQQLGNGQPSHALPSFRARRELVTMRSHNSP